jgi:hypothetical protein
MIKRPFKDNRLIGPIDVMENEYTVYQANIAASVEVDSSIVPDPFEGTEFIEEPTDVEN